MVSRGYDGIDLDWEVLAGPMRTSSPALVNGFTFGTQRNHAAAAVDGRNRHAAGAGGVAAEPIRFRSPDDVSAFQALARVGCWHNAPIYDGGFRFPSTGAPVPSAGR